MITTNFGCTSSRAVFRAVVGALTTLAALNCGAFGIGPVPARLNNEQAAEVNKWALQPLANGFVTTYENLFRTAVHEVITRAAYRCQNGTADECLTAEVQNSMKDGKLQNVSSAPETQFLIEGVEWNDNPPFRIKSWGPIKDFGCFGPVIQLPNAFPDCWLSLMASVTQVSSFASPQAYKAGSPILLRSHFGDLQFLHSMATTDGESAARTLGNIVSWATFAYKVSTGEIPTGTIVSNEQVMGDAAKLFPKYGMDVGTLFIQGTEPDTPDRVRDIAFGSILHMVEDSLSAAHVDRDPPMFANGQWQPSAIHEFHSYAHQNPEKHSGADTLSAATGDEHRGEAAVDAVRLLRQAREKARKAPGQDNGLAVFIAALRSLYVLAPDARDATPGDEYRWVSDIQQTVN